MKLGKQFSDPPKGCHYASIFHCLATDKMFELKGFVDAYNPQFDRESIMKNVCKVCLAWFPSQKLMLAHRKKLHPRSRIDNLEQKEQEDEDYHDEIEDLLDEAEVQFYESKERVKDYRDRQYLVEMEDGTESWITLPDDDENVCAYWESQEGYDECEVENDTDGFPIIKNLQEWNMCPWIPADRNEHKEEE